MMLTRVKHRRRSPHNRLKSSWYAPFRLRARGFTLTEILLSSLILSVVILVAWTGLISVLNMSQAAQARTARKVELNTALDILSNEIRQARTINQAEGIVADGTSVTLADVVTQGGVNLDALGPYGDLALYIEIPFKSTAPAICPAGTENAANPPIGPTTYDPVVYDIRTSPSGWLAPKAIARYGRIPELDGSLNPCSNPVANDIIADALADQIQTSPTCAGGVIAGSAGFQTCTEGQNVELFLESAISDISIASIKTSVTPRAFNFTPPISPTVGTLNLQLTPSSSNQVNLTWSWSDSPPQLSSSYELQIQAQSGGQEQRALGVDKLSLNSYSLNQVASGSGDTVCFTLNAFPDNAPMVSSNQVCSTTTVINFDD